MISFIRKFFKKEKNNYDRLVKEINKIYTKVPQDFGGGCSLEKAMVMSLLIEKYNLQTSVDIGVYRGRSLFPQAIAHKLYSNGTVYGVDPYTKEDANQADYPEIQKELDSFVQKTDFQELYNQVSKIIHDNYKDNCILIREKSSDAVAEFRNMNKSLDMVHIDGNHDTKFVMEDVENYLPLLGDKSFIILDDVSWNSVKPATDILSRKMNFIHQLIDKQNDFAVFAKGLTDDEIIDLKKTILKTIG